MVAPPVEGLLVRLDLWKREVGLQLVRWLLLLLLTLIVGESSSESSKKAAVLVLRRFTYGLGDNAEGVGDVGLAATLPLYGTCG